MIFSFQCGLLINELIRLRTSIFDFLRAIGFHEVMAIFWMHSSTSFAYFFSFSELTWVDLPINHFNFSWKWILFERFCSKWTPSAINLYTKILAVNSLQFSIVCVHSNYKILFESSSRYTAVLRKYQHVNYFDSRCVRIIGNFCNEYSVGNYVF